MGMKHNDVVAGPTPSVQHITNTTSSRHVTTLSRDTGESEARGELFTGDTLVETSEGRIRVADLFQLQQRGEMLPLIFAFDLNSRLPALVRIWSVEEVGEARRLIEVSTDKNVSLLLTSRHSLLTYDGRLRPPEALRPGTRLRKLSRSSIPQRSDRRVIYTRLNESGEYQSRWMYEQVHGPIPENMHIHHVNGDPTDDRLSNFELTDGRKHIAEHSTGANNPRFISCDMALRLEVYDHVMAHGRPRGGVVRLTVGRWNRAIHDLGLKGRVPLASTKGEGRIQGRAWSDFAREVEEAASVVNDRVAKLTNVELDEPIRTYALETEEGALPFLSDGHQLHALAVAASWAGERRRGIKPATAAYRDRAPVVRMRRRQV